MIVSVHSLAQSIRTRGPIGCVRLMRWLQVRLGTADDLDAIECFLLARVEDVLHGRS